MRVIPRSEWGAKASGGNAIGRVSLVIIHHSWRPHLECDVGEKAEVDAVRGIERYHVQSNGWSAIGYNFLVAQSGRAFEGRGWGIAGAHTAGQNSKSVGICLLIDGDSHEPTKAAVEAVRDIIRQGVQQGRIAADFKIRGHHDFAAKSCPGTKVYPKLGVLFGAVT